MDSAGKVFIVVECFELRPVQTLKVSTGSSIKDFSTSPRKAVRTVSASKGFKPLNKSKLNIPASVANETTNTHNKICTSNGVQELVLHSKDVALSIKRCHLNVFRAKGIKANISEIFWSQGRSLFDESREAEEIYINLRPGQCTADLLKLLRCGDIDKLDIIFSDGQKEAYYTKNLEQCASINRDGTLTLIFS